MQGTSKRTYQQIAEELDSLGGTLNAATGADALTVDASVLAENADKMLALMSDVSRNAIFPAERAESPQAEPQADADGAAFAARLHGE